MPNAEKPEMRAPLEVGICVVDLDRMVEFYVAGLGCTEQMRMPIPTMVSAPTGMGPDGFVMAWLQTPWGERIKLLGPEASPAPAQRRAHLTERQGLAYLSFYVADLATLIDQLVDLGASAVSDGPVVDLGPLHIAFVADPEGNVLELIEHDDIASYRPDLA
jgi:catechol 2,3-dioxygenase-like lactoylglutathione lyase family enzyme